MLVVAGLAFGILSSVVGYECHLDRWSMPKNPVLLETLSGGAAICVLLLFFFGGADGFWLPIIGCVIGFALCSIWWGIGKRFLDPALVSTLSGITAIGVSVAWFI